MDTENQFLRTERIGKLMRQYAIPCIISLLVGALYNIVDQIFIANASYLGSYGNAANTVVFPLTVVALAIAVMVGDGCCAFVSMALGRSKVDKAKRSVGNAVVLSIVGSLVLTAVYLIFANDIIAMFGGTVNEETFRHSQEYFFYITLGIPFYMFGQAMNPIIRADGNPKFAMISTLTGAVINIILDPHFHFLLQVGYDGCGGGHGHRAGIYGDPCPVVSAAYEDHQARLRRLCPAGRHLRADADPGHHQLALPDQPCGGYGSHQQYAPQIRRAGPCVRAGAVCPDPHGGGGHRDEVLPDRHLHRGRHGGRLHPRRGLQHGRGEKAPCAGAVHKAFGGRGAGGRGGACAGGVLPPRQLIAIFGAANESSYYTDFAIKAFRTYLCMMVLACVNKACFIFLQAVGKALSSTLLSMFREVVFGVGFALLLPVLFDLDGVLYSMPVSDILTFIISAMIIVKIYRELNTEGVRNA